LVHLETVAEVLARRGQRTPFIVEGLINTSATMVYGQPKAGKSFLTVDLADALASGASSWLGQPINGGPHRVAFGLTDSGGDFETAERLHALGHRAEDRVLVCPVRPETDWPALVSALRAKNVTVFILDNLLTAMPPGADPNSAKDTRIVTDALIRLNDAGIAVVLVHHAPKAEAGTAMGSQQITAWARTILKLTGKGDSRALNVKGNHGPEETYRLRVEFVDGGARFTLASRDSGSEAAEDTAPKEKRGDVTYARGSFILDRITAPEWRHLSCAEAARRLHAEAPAELQHSQSKSWENSIRRLVTGKALAKDEVKGWHRPLRAVS
jgi:hypothetical protein